MARDLSDLLGFYGIRNSFFTRVLKNVKFPNGKEYNKEYLIYELKINDIDSIKHFNKLFEISNKDKSKKISKIVNFESKQKVISNNVRVVEVNKTNLKEDVWDVAVQDETHCFKLSHCVTGNCGEVILRPYQLCNLSEVVVRPEDTFKTLKQKVIVATMLGTWQSTFTNFKFVNKTWKKNCDEECS